MTDDELVERLRLLNEVDAAVAADRIEVLRGKIAVAIAHIERDGKNLAATFGPDADWRKVLPYSASVVAGLKDGL